MINPEIFNESIDNTFEMYDDCLSFPYLLVRVKRFSTINVKFKNENY